MCVWRRLPADAGVAEVGVSWNPLTVAALCPDTQCPQLWRGLHDLLLVRELLDRKRLDSAATLTVFSEPGAAAALRAGVAQVWTRLSRRHPDRDDRSGACVCTCVFARDCSLLSFWE